MNKLHPSFWSVACVEWGIGAGNLNPGSRYGACVCGHSDYSVMEMMALTMIDALTADWVTLFLGQAVDLRPGNWRYLNGDASGNAR